MLGDWKVEQVTLRSGYCYDIFCLGRLKGGGGKTHHETFFSYHVLTVG